MLNSDIKMKRYLVIILLFLIGNGLSAQSILLKKPIPDYTSTSGKYTFKNYIWQSDVRGGLPYSINISTKALDTSNFVTNEKKISDKDYDGIYISDIDSSIETFEYIKNETKNLYKSIDTLFNHKNFDGILYLKIFKYRGDLNDLADTSLMPFCDIVANRILNLAKPYAKFITIYADHPFNYQFKGFEKLEYLDIEMEKGFKVIDTATLNKYTYYLSVIDNLKKNNTVSCKELLEFTSKNFYLDRIVPINISFDSILNKKNNPISLTLHAKGFKNLPQGIENLKLFELNLDGLIFDSLPNKLFNNQYSLFKINGQFRYIGNLLNYVQPTNIITLCSAYSDECCNKYTFKGELNFEYSQAYFRYKRFKYRKTPYDTGNKNGYYYNYCQYFYNYSDTFGLEKDYLISLLIDSSSILIPQNTFTSLSIHPLNALYPTSHIKMGKNNNEYQHEQYVACGNDLIISKDSLLPITNIDSNALRYIELYFIDSSSLLNTQGKGLNNLKLFKNKNIQLFFDHCDIDYIIKNTNKKALENIEHCYIDSYSLEHLSYKEFRKLKSIKLISCPIRLIDKSKINSYPDSTKKILKFITSKKMLKSVKEYNFKKSDEGIK